tara:strand:+ start:353 stop:1219 length:867 start_codon:yes stop_codon:yes gene_type:complete
MTNSQSSIAEEYFVALSETPSLSWQGLGFFLLGTVILIFASSAALSGQIPLWSASLLNGFALYLFFAIMHESLHDTASTNHLTNDILGRFSLMFLIPAAPIEIARWIHLKHHACTSSPDDPDNFMHHGKWWVLPLRWANFDLFYLVHFFRYAGSAASKSVTLAVVVQLGSYILLIGACAVNGFGLEVLMLYIIPSRIGLALVGFVFVFLPHYPADISARENKYQATTIRQGWEWLLTPLMVYQNYHLIHHLYPNIPFYNIIKVWDLQRDELMAKRPAMQTAFGLRPSS